MALYEGNQVAETCFQAADGLTLVRSSLGLSQSFILQQYLRVFLQKGYSVVFVAAEQSFERYQYALKKTGLSLQPYQLSGHLHVVAPPLAPLTGPPTLQPPVPPPPPPPFVPPQQPAQGTASSSSSSGTVVGGGCSALRQLFEAVRRPLDQPPPPAVAGVAVILDSLTVLASTRESEQEWAAFLHYCCDGAMPAAAQRAAQVPRCVVAGAYGDVPEDGSWLASLQHRANMVVSVESLPGRIADLDGMVTFTRRFSTEEASGGAGQPVAGAAAAVPEPPPWDATSRCPWRKSLYFKSSELAVKWTDRVTARELM